MLEEIYKDSLQDLRKGEIKTKLFGKYILDLYRTFERGYEHNMDRINLIFKYIGLPNNIQNFVLGFQGFLEKDIENVISLFIAAFPEEIAEKELIVAIAGLAFEERDFEKTFKHLYTLLEYIGKADLFGDIDWQNILENPNVKFLKIFISACNGEIDQLGTLYDMFYLEGKSLICSFISAYSFRSSNDFEKASKIILENLNPLLK